MYKYFTVHSLYHTQVSKESVEFHMCDGKADRSQCGCTEEMELSADAEFSDCRKRVRYSFRY